jgi:hypothetical protein
MSDQRDDDFRTQVADEIDRLLAREPRDAPKAPPALPAEPDLVAHWRQIIAYRDKLCETITKWETAPFELGDMPRQQLRGLHSLLSQLDEELVTKARYSSTPNSRGHTVEQLGKLAAIPAEAERTRKAYWVELWLSQKRHDHRPLTAATVRAELGVDDLEELERSAREWFSREDRFKPRSEVALRMVLIAEERQRSRGQRSVHSAALTGDT